MPDAAPGQNLEFVLRPRFIGWATILGQIPYNLVFALLALNVGPFVGAAMSEPPDRTIHFAYFVVPPVLVIAVTPVLLFRAKRRRYRQREYRFFRDRLLLHDGYAFDYRNVKKVILRRGLLGRLTGLGTLRLMADIEGFEVLSVPNLGVVTKDGIVLKDIPDPDQVLRRVQELVDARKR